MSTLFDVKFIVNNLKTNLLDSITIVIVDGVGVLKNSKKDILFDEIESALGEKWLAMLCGKLAHMEIIDQVRFLEKMSIWLDEQDEDIDLCTNQEFIKMTEQELSFVNLTPHAIMLNDGYVFEPSGVVARVAVSYSAPSWIFTRQVYGEVENLPDPEMGTYYIVSGMVLAACSGRSDVVAPATGHPDVVRNEKGHIVSVPYLTFS